MVFVLNILSLCTCRLVGVGVNYYSWLIQPEFGSSMENLELIIAEQYFYVLIEMIFFIILLNKEI